MNGREVFNFFDVAAQVASVNIRAYPPQAIANCCWAFNRLSQKGHMVEVFGRLAADEALRRIDEFAWQDLSGIVSALMNTTPQNSISAAPWDIFYSPLLGVRGSYPGTFFRVF